MNPLVMLGTDFSETALHAAAGARRLGAALGGDVEVVHVREGMGRSPFVLTDTAMAWLEEAGVGTHELSLRSGTPWVELVRLSSEREAYLIVVGTHGSTGRQPMALGSTAQRLALLAPRPVVLVGRRGGGVEAGGERTGRRAQIAGEESLAPDAPGIMGHHHSKRIVPWSATPG